MSDRLRTLLLLLTAAVVLGLAFVLGGNGEFAGTDSTATQAIQETRPGYRAWFSQSWAPQSAEVQSGLFAAQAALGAGVLGFILGTLRERGRRRREEAVDVPPRD